MLHRFFLALIIFCFIYSTLAEEQLLDNANFASRSAPLPAGLITDGTYFSTIDDLWDVSTKCFLVHESFVRMQNVTDTNNRYEETVKAASSKNGEVAEMSSRNGATASTDGLKIDIFGHPSESAHSAHLLPHGPSCSPFWFPVVPWVLSTKKLTLTWNFMQKCIHGITEEK